MSLPGPSLAHLARLTDDTGVFEHAFGSVPRRDHGWCTDDNGRALAVACRVGGAEAERLAGIYLAFLLDAHEGGGRFRLRMGYDRGWTEHPPSDDANARALYGVAVASTVGPSALAWAAGSLFDEAAAFRSPHPRATAQAAVAAAEVVRWDPERAGAWAILAEAARSLPRPPDDPAWPWPAPRLTYANALIPEGLLAAGAALGDEGLVADGLALLRWLVEEETFRDRFSFAPTEGRGPGEDRPAFGQQPIEAASFADACARALDVTGDPAWLTPLERAAAWLCGANDVGVALLDPVTGGGADGLETSGASHNQGAESTIAAVETLWQAHRLLPAERLASIEVTDQRAAASAASR